MRAARSARPGDRAAPCRDDEHHDAGDAALRHRAQGGHSRAGPPPARPAPARISATPGSSATRRTSSPASGSAMTTTRRPRRPPAAACRWKSGPASCAWRIRACRWQDYRILAASAVSCRTCSRAARKSATPPPSAPLQSAQAPVPLRPIPSDNGYRPAPTRASAPPPQPNTRPEPAAGLDGWLVDRLFGGR